MLRPFFPTRPWLWLGRLAVLLLMLAVVGAGVTTGALLALSRESPPMDEFENFSPHLISRVIDRTGEEVVAEFFVERREFVPMPSAELEPQAMEGDTIPWTLILAYMAIEDERFYEHVGVDPVGIGAAVFARLTRGGRLRGASTLTQQLARKVLEDITDVRRLERKIREALAALQIEARYSKSQILEFYLNQIPMGNGIYGVQAAALNYFGVPVSELTLAQCATIAGIAALPERFNPRDALENAARGREFHYGRGPDDATARRDLVLQRMRRLSFITEDEFEQARAEPMALGSSPSRLNRAPYFVDLIRRQVLADSSLGRAALYEQGIVIQSTVDVELQGLAERTLSAGLASVEALWQRRKIERLWEEEEPDEMGWRVDEGERRLVRIAEVTETGLLLELNGYVGDAALSANLPYFDPENILREGNLVDVEVLECNHGQRTFRARLLDEGHVQGSLLVLEVESGDILAMVGGADWFDEANAGQWNRAFLGGRQPGSCFKPFVYAAAMEMGLTPATMFNDKRVEFGGTGSSPLYVPRNFEGVHFGPTTLIEGLEHSRNVATVLMTERLGARRLRDFAGQFDFTRDRARWNIQPHINMGLGVHDVTPLELACGFAAFPNGGRLVRPRAWAAVTDQSGRLVRDNRPPERRVMRRETARQVLRMMEQVMASGSGERTIGRFLLGEPGVPALAGKTGTTSDNIDAWFAGMTPEWVVVVSVGFDNNVSLGPRMTGSEVAGPIWREFMREALRMRPAQRMEFATPPGLVARDICSQTGLLWSEHCEEARRRDPTEVVRYRDVLFTDGTEPQRECPFDGPYQTYLDLPENRALPPIGQDPWAVPLPGSAVSLRADPG